VTIQKKNLSPSQLLKNLDQQRVIFRLWAHDPSLFGTGKQILMFDWLHEPTRMLDNLFELEQTASKITSKNFKFIVLLGMGGSSLAAKVFAGCSRLDTKSLTVPQFFIIDTIHPSAITRLEKTIELAHTLFIVASKSGSTLEPNILYQYFYSRLKADGQSQPGKHFLAITDPSSPLLQKAKDLDFMPGPQGVAGIGGRYSALSPFGILPALVMGLDTHKLLESAAAMAHDCGPTLNDNTNPGAKLAVFLASNVLTGQYILHLHCSPSLASLGAWLEQLIAESLGKNSTGIVPIIDGYSRQKLSMHCYIELSHEPISGERLANNMSFTLDNFYDLGQEMFRWQMAISLAAIILKVNPFDQPDVERSKALAQKRQVISTQAPSLSTTISEFLSAHQQADYCVLLSYLDENPENQALLKSVCDGINQKGLSCLIQAGPRYLHSTGQLWKGGANKGSFIIITGEYQDHVKLGNLDFSEAHKNQAMNDYQTMIDCGRSVLHIHLKNIGDLCSLQ